MGAEHPNLRRSHGAVNRAREVTGYDPIRLLGTGSYGEVWEARTRGGRPAALKIIDRARGAEEAGLELAALEASVELSHPFLLQTTEAWVEEDLVVIAMELADGTLRQRLQWCRSQGLQGIPANELLSYLREAAQALDYLHARGKLHRDIKPDNVLLVNTASPPAHAKVGDIGLLRDISQLTMTARGTPAYIAPEAWGRSACPASDQFSLAVTYAELRQGRRPYPNGNLMALIEAVNLYEPDLAGLEPAERVALARALGRSPHERYPSCQEMVEALEKALGRRAADYKPRVARVELANRPAGVAPTGTGPLPGGSCTSTAADAHRAPMPTRPATNRPARGPAPGGHFGTVLACLLGLAAVAGAVWWGHEATNTPAGPAIARPEEPADGPAPAQAEAKGPPRQLPPTAEKPAVVPGAEELKRGQGLFAGRGGLVDEPKGLALIKKSAELGHPAARAALAWHLYHGLGVTKDLEAARWQASQAADAVRKLAEAGDADAQRALGLLLQDGLGVPRDDKEAVKWFRLAARQNDALAKNHLGLAYKYGRGVARDDVRGAEWFREAAEQGLPHARFNLGLAYKFGQGVEKDLAESAAWLRKAAEQGHAGAQNDLGWAYLNAHGVERDDALAVKWFRQSAERGNAVAQGNLGFVYAEGRGVARDHEESVKWTRLAADRNLSFAQFNLGLAYKFGRGVEKDAVEAARWFRKAAEGRHLSAQFNLGLALVTGQGVDRDVPEGVTWFRKAAERGHAASQANLGRAYERGEGVEKDTDEAIRWYRKAAAQGHALAKQRLEKIDDGKLVDEVLR